MLTDLHVHSNNSPDADSSVIEDCVSALEKHIGILAITDHCEIECFEKENYERAIKQSFFDVLRAKDVFAGRLEILQGIELGNMLSDLPKAKEVVHARPYDFVLGSLHCLKGMQDFYFLDYNKQEPKKLLATYFDEIEQMVDEGGFDVLAHLTYPLRYMNGEYHQNIDIKQYKEPITRIFKKIIQKGIGLEINTSGLRQAYGHCLPGLWTVSLYHDLGGEIITVGSDAHEKTQVGMHIFDGLRLAQKAGFSVVHVFRARKPFPVPIAL
ncbi:MAG TPA: histidinol phosphate phosphatase [Ruminococcaceae bacterium]|nr:histidinol phosphate phosphatase [Oscillospiraceae bacterium]